MTQHEYVSHYTITSNYIEDYKSSIDGKITIETIDSDHGNLDKFS